MKLIGHSSGVVGVARVLEQFAAHCHGTPARYAGLALISTVLGCAPLQYGNDQVPDINVNFTALKDSQFGAMPATVDAIVAAYLAAPGAPPGCAVGIMQNNAITHLKGYGLSDVISGDAFTRGTPSVVGSVSKTWTALAVLRLQELGFLDLQDTLTDHLSSVPPAWQQITIEQLLSHTSGLPHNPVFDLFINDEAELNSFLFQVGPFPQHPGIHPRWVYYSYHQTPVVGFPLGATATYSNVGYMIAGAILDKIVKQNSAAIGSNFASFESFVWRYVGVFDGNLNNGDQMLSQCLWEYWRLTDIPDLVKGYRFVDPGYKELTHTNNAAGLLDGPAGWEGPAGGWTMTIGDLVRLMVAIQNNDVISPATKSLMMQVYGAEVDGNGDPTNQWGLGVNLIEKLGRPVFMHDGVIAGYRARYTVWPGENFGVAIMANEEGADMRDITDDIAVIFIGPSPESAGGGGFNDDDPGVAAVVSDVHVEPEITSAERQEIIQEHQELQQRQLLIEGQRQQLAGMLDDCAPFATALVIEHGVELTEPFALCFDSAVSEMQFNVCIRLATDDLVKSGIITEQQQLDLQGCATFIYRFPCWADLDDDDFVGITDFLVLLGAWGTPGGDVDGDGTTGILDFLELLANWGSCL